MLTLMLISRFCKIPLRFITGLQAKTDLQTKIMWMNENHVILQQDCKDAFNKLNAPSLT